MFSFIIDTIKIIFMLGFLVLIHEGGHFIVAKLLKIQVNEFSIGFGKKIWSKKIGDTIYSIRLLPLGGYVNMEGEEEHSEKEGSFSKTKIYKKILIVLAGAFVNIIFGLISFFILVWIKYDLLTAITSLNNFIISITMSFVNILKGKIYIEQMTGVIGISNIIVTSQNLFEYIYIISLISISLGLTNLLPIPPLDGGKIIFYLIEKIRKKPLSQEIELKIQSWGFSILILVSIYITYKDILKIF